MNYQRLVLTLFAVLALAVGAAGQGGSQPFGTGLGMGLATTDRATPAPRGAQQVIHVPDNDGGSLLLDVELDGVPVELRLWPHSLRARDFRLLMADADGSLTEVPAPASRTWRGRVVGHERATVSASLSSRGWTATVADPERGVEWRIVPAANGPLGAHEVSRHALLARDPIGLGTASLGTGLQLCELALDADFEYFLLNGSSVDATVDDIEEIIGRVDTIFARDCDVTFQITQIVVRSSAADPYTSNDVNTLLAQLRNEWQNSLAGVRRDLVHLFTGRNLIGVDGAAFIGVVCSTANGYGLSRSRFTSDLTLRTALTARMFGFNFSATACDATPDCRIMCSMFGGCSGDITSFGPTSAATIRSYAIGRPCLLDLAPPLVVPFRDEFPTTQLDREIWISEQGVDVSDAAENEPTLPNAAELAASGVLDPLDDVLISNRILLGGLGAARVGLHTQHRGVPAGGALSVEILDAAGD
ncbi:MAG: zinc-dependent metalloprotease family protein [Planctomycetota bacterium]